jgi:hypothetical protein
LWFGHIEAMYIIGPAVGLANKRPDPIQASSNKTLKNCTVVSRLAYVTQYQEVSRYEYLPTLLAVLGIQARAEFPDMSRLIPYLGVNI